MLAILSSLNAHSFPIFQPSKFMVHRALSDKAYLFLGLLFPLISYALVRILEGAPKS